MASTDVKACHKLTAKVKSLIKTLSESMDGHADVSSVLQCLNALRTAYCKLESACEGLEDVAEETRDQLNEVKEGLGQDIYEIEQRVAEYEQHEGEVDPTCNNVSMTGDAHTSVSSRRRAQNVRKNTSATERNRMISVEQQELARQREEFERQKLEHVRAVELFRAEQAAMRAEYEKRVEERDKASERSASALCVNDNDATMVKQRMRAVQPTANVSDADIDVDDDVPAVERPSCRTRKRRHTSLVQQRLSPESTAAAVAGSISGNVRRSPQRRRTDRLDDVTT